MANIQHRSFICIPYFSEACDNLEFLLIYTSDKSQVKSIKHFCRCYDSGGIFRIELSIVVIKLWGQTHWWRGWYGYNYCFSYLVTVELFPLQVTICWGI